MNLSSIAGLFALVVNEPAVAAAAAPWWQAPWAGWLIAVSVFVVPTLLAWFVAKRLRLPDMWGRIAVVLVTLAAGGSICWLGWPPRLGIDLKGGLILVYEVATGRQREERIDDAIAVVERLAAAQDGAKASVERREGGRFEVKLETTEAAAREAIVAAIKDAEFDRATVKEVGRRSTKDALLVDYAVTAEQTAIPMDKLVAAVSRRVNPGGQKEVTVRQFGLDQIEVILPEVEQSEVEQIKTIISKAGVLEFRILANPADPRHRAAITQARRSRSTTVRLNSEVAARWVLLDTSRMEPDERMVTRAGDDVVEVLVIIDSLNVAGNDLSRVSASHDDATLSPCVSFNLNARGAGKFGVLTKQNLPDPANGLESRLGIVLDDNLESAPVIQSQITSNGQITGRFTQEEVDTLVEILNAGSLPAALKAEPISEQRVSSQLGDDTIRSASMAMVLATVLVLVFMAGYYRFAGVVADLAVLMNVVLVVAVMISFKVAFTLAGLAGLVLSVGMAVDANVLIYERIREELDRGAALRMAIRNGFQRAFSTILDSNLTTLITGVVLFSIGTDQLKGFAITLVLGLALNLFTAVFCARVAFDMAERSRWLTKLSMGRILNQTHIAFVKWAPAAAIAAVVVILLGAAAAYRRGSELFDIDFTGGTSVQVEFKEGEELPIAEVRKALGEKLRSVTVSAVSLGEGVADRRFKIDTSEQDQAKVQEMLQDVFPGRLATASMTFGDVGPAQAAEPPSEPAADPTAEAQEPDVLISSVRLEFPDLITKAGLIAILKDALASEFAPDAEFAVASEEPDSATEPCRAWDLLTALDVDATRRVVERMAATMAGTPLYLSANAIGGKVAGSTRVTALYALAASLGLIVIYVWIRFQNVAFGLASVVALAHDVLIALAALAASRFLAPFMGWALVDEFRISLDVVAALLTIVGFSINDTIVIFDRLREIRGKAKFLTPEMVDRGLNQTLSRTILTSGTAFLAVLILYAVGGSGIHAFAFTMLVGVVVGTYSSVFIAAPMVLWLQHRFGGVPGTVAGGIARPA
jgi:SecD/SecF fusion protein